MKVDIPDSIIISRDEDGVLHHSYWTTDQQLVPFEATKFIRKDALLEWLEGQLETLKPLLDTDPYKEAYIGKCEAFKEVIDKLNEM